MFLWIGLAVGFVLLVVVMSVVARRIDRMEDDTTYAREEQPFTPYGQKYLDIMLFRGGDD